MSVFFCKTQSGVWLNGTVFSQKGEHNERMCEPGGLGFVSEQEEAFSSHATSTQNLGLHNPSIQWMPEGALSIGKATGTWSWQFPYILCYSSRVCPINGAGFEFQLLPKTECCKRTVGSKRRNKVRTVHRCRSYRVSAQHNPTILCCYTTTQCWGSL